MTGKNKSPVIFLLSGHQGSQYVNMGWDLYQKEPVFRQDMDRCFEILKLLMGYDLKEILYPGDSLSAESSYKSSSPNMSSMSSMSYKSDNSMINQTEITQPVLFAFEYALARLLMKWGITPGAMMGYSMGEYIAACLSGVFSLEDALKLVTARGQLMRQTQAGAMLSVPLPTYPFEGKRYWIDENPFKKGIELPTWSRVTQSLEVSEPEASSRQLPEISPDEYEEEAEELLE